MFCRAQDVHFSQFFHNPLNQNPALTGNYDGVFRGVANQRTQWRSVTVPYNTFAIGAEAKSLFFDNRLSVGAQISNDRAGDSRLNTFKVNFSGSWAHRINNDSSFVATGGLQLGFTNRTIDYSKLSFDNQFNGFIYDPNLDDGEDFRRDSRFYPNVNLGALIYRRLGDRKFVQGGVALHNITKPIQSFYNDEQIRLDRRLTIHARGEVPYDEKWSVEPAIQWMRQGTYNEVLLGGMGKYTFISELNIHRALLFGYYGRFGDSGVLMAAMEYDRWRAGISYDINLSDLEQASRNRGGFEFSIIHLWGGSNLPNTQHRLCPDFL